MVESVNLHYDFVDCDLRYLTKIIEHYSILSKILMQDIKISVNENFIRTQENVQGIQG